VSSTTTSTKISAKATEALQRVATGLAANPSVKMMK
jgi:hypothetical protein